MKILDALLLKEVVDIGRLLIEDLYIVKYMIKIQDSIALIYSSRYQCVVEYYYAVVQEDLKKIAF